MVDELIDKYLTAIVAHDWDTVRAVVAEDVVRIGPYGETFEGRGPYVDYLAGLMPHLEDYSMQRRAVSCAEGGRRAFAELSEHVTMNGKATVTDEVLVFDINGAGLIQRVEIYMRKTS